MILIILFLIALCIYLFSTRSSPSSWDEKQIEKAGKEGEQRAFNDIKTILHKDDVLLTNVPIRTDDDVSEVDALIVNRCGVFIIEVKNYEGNIRGNEDDYKWVKVKTTKAGNTYEKQIENPIRQVKREVYILSNMLKDHRIFYAWVDGYAYLINQKIRKQTGYIVCDLKDIERIIHTPSKKPLSSDQVRQIVSVLK